MRENNVNAKVKKAGFSLNSMEEKREWAVVAGAERKKD